MSSDTSSIGSNVGFFFLLFGGVIAFAFGVSYVQRV